MASGNDSAVVPDFAVVEALFLQIRAGRSRRAPAMEESSRCKNAPHNGRTFLSAGFMLSLNEHAFQLGRCALTVTTTNLSVERKVLLHVSACSTWVLLR